MSSANEIRDKYPPCSRCSPRKRLLYFKKDFTQNRMDLTLYCDVFLAAHIPDIWPFFCPNLQQRLILPFWDISALLWKRENKEHFQYCLCVCLCKCLCKVIILRIPHWRCSLRVVVFVFVSVFLYLSSKVDLFCMCATKVGRFILSCADFWDPTFFIDFLHLVI